MVSDLFFSPLMLIALVGLSALPKRQRTPKPFAGLTPKPHCNACKPAPLAPPRLVSTRGRRHPVDGPDRLGLGSRPPHLTDPAPAEPDAGYP